MKNNFTSEEFRELLKEGNIENVNGKLISHLKHETPVILKKKKKKKTVPMDNDHILSTIKHYAERERIYIPYDVRSSKNSRQIGYKRLIMSSAAQEYVILSAKWWNIQKTLFKKLIKDKKDPVEIGFYWIRGSKQKWDYINMMQLPCDLMTKNGWIKDDDIFHLKPFIVGYEINKENRGLVLNIL
jgi:hypothetical protein